MDKNTMTYPTASVHAPIGVFNGIANQGINQYLGIRYAAAPLGELRFKPPQPQHYDSETIDASAYGNRNYQVGWPEEIFSELERQGEESEDCLFLNVFAPREIASPKPVLVWIHGGAFMCGSGNDYNPSRIVHDNDVIVVTINYRLGVFGFLNIAEASPDFADSANLGIQDQIAALQWVQDNIKAFGGDVSNITIWGESAGAASVLALMGAPSASGLFHKAIVFSGAETLSPASDHLSPIKALLGTKSNETCVDKLNTLSAQELTALQLQSQIYVGPWVDDKVITRPPVEAIHDGGAKSIPVLAGTCRDEGTILAPGFMPTPEIGAAVVAGLAASIGRDTGAAYMQFLTEKFGAEDTMQHMIRAWFDVFRASALRVASTASEHGAGGWVYNFEVETDHELGIAHFADVPFTFNWLADEKDSAGLFTHPATEVNKTLAESWSKTIMAFAKTGLPNGEGLPQWPQYTSDNYPCLRLCQEPHIADNPDGDMLTIYQVR